MSELLRDRVILVTGASRGLGRAVALEAAKVGGRVIAIARTQGGLEELDDEARAMGHTITLLPLDLLDGDAVDRLGPSIGQRFSRLDGLAHCAGELGPLTPTHQLDPTALERAIRVNALTAHRLIRSLDPLLRQSNSARLIFVTDANARSDRPFFAAYSAGKMALEAIVRAYAAETAKTAIRSEIIDPGPMQTRLRRQAYPGEADDLHPSPECAARRIVSLMG